MYFLLGTHQVVKIGGYSSNRYVSLPEGTVASLSPKPIRKPFKLPSLLKLVVQEGVERPEDGNSERPENAPLQGNEVPQQ